MDLFLFFIAGVVLGQQGVRETIPLSLSISAVFIAALFASCVGQA